MKKISFIIPMYNAGKFIGDCLKSIFDQGLEEEDFEVIVVDDGSIDDGKDIVKQFDSVKYFYQENGGQASARNVGLSRALGQYVCFVDSDDMLVPNSIGVVLQKAIEHELDMLTYDMASQYDKVVSGERLSKMVSGVEYISNNNYNNGPWWYIVKRECVDDLRFVEGRYGEDGMFTMELLMRVKRVAHIDRHCYLYIRREGSTTTRKDEAHMKKMIADYMFVYHHMHGLIEKYRSSLNNGAIIRCTERSESYLFFLLVRLLRFPNGGSLIKETLSAMKKEGIYPIKRMNREEYPGVQYVVIHFIVNHPWLLMCTNKIYQILKR